MKTSPPPFGEGDGACKAAHSFLCGILSVLWLGRILAGQNSRCMVWSAVRNTSHRHLYFTTPTAPRQCTRTASRRSGYQKNFWKRRKSLCIGRSRKPSGSLQVGKWLCRSHHQQSAGSCTAVRRVRRGAAAGSRRRIISTLLIKYTTGQKRAGRHQRPVRFFLIVSGGRHPQTPP